MGLTTNSVPSDGSSETAGFSSPGAITLDASGNLYVVDNGNNTIKKLITYVVPNIPLRPASAPSALEAYAGNTFVNLVWSPPALSESSGLAITGYSITATPVLAGMAAQPILVKDTFAKITGLTNGTLYTFSVSAVNSLGSSSATATATPLGTISTTAPNPPTGVSAVRDNKAAIVSWTAPTNNGGSPITGYKVTFVSGGLTAFSAVVASTATSAPAVGLLNGTSYTVSVFAINNYGISTAGTTSVTPAAVTYAPFITSSTYADRSVTLNWIPNTPSGVSAPTGFTLFYKVTSGGGESSVSYGASLRTATITGLTNNTQYTFRIIATNPVGQSPSSQLVNITPNPTAPSSITVGTLTPKDQSAVVRWTAPYNGGAAVTRYTITAIDSNNNSIVINVPANVGSPTAAETALLSAAQSSAVSWKFNGLTNGTSYRFTVLATNGYPNANGQATATPLSTSSASPLRVVPDPVTNVATIAGNYQVTVSWPALDLNTWSVPGTPGAVGEEVTKYILTVCDSTGVALSTITPNPIEFTDPSYTNATAGTTLAHTVTGLTNINYIFKVSSVNSIGESAATSSATVMALVEPAKPTNLSASPNQFETNMTLAWTPPPNGVPGTPIITKYIVNVYDTDGVTLLTVYDPTPSITNTPSNIPNLILDKQYYFSIIARNSVGVSPESDKVSGTPIYINPSIPQNLTATLSGDYATDANLSWSASTGSISYPVTGYTIIAINTTDNTETPYSATNSPYTVSGLTTGKSFRFKIKSENGRSSAYSPETSPITTGTIAQPVITTIDQTNSGNKKVNFSVEYGARISNISYKLYKATVTGGPGGSVGTYTATTINNSGALQFTGVIINVGTTYSFYMTYLNTSNNQESSPSNIIEVTGATVPGSVSVTSLTPQDTYITVNWNPPSSDGGSPIRYYIITAYYSDNTVVSTQNTSDASTSFNYTGLFNGVTYKFNVKAVNDIGPGINTNYSSTSTPTFNIVTPSTFITFPAANNPATNNSGLMTYDSNMNRLYVVDTDDKKPYIIQLNGDGSLNTYYQIPITSYNPSGANGAYQPYGIDVDSNNNIYLSVTGSNNITKLTYDSSNNNYTQSKFNTNTTLNFKFPYGIALDSTGTYAYFTEQGTFTGEAGTRVLRINITDTTPTATTLFTIGGGELRGIILDSSDNIYIAATGSRVIYKAIYTGSGGNYNTPTVYAGILNTAGTINGPVSQATLSGPISMAIDSRGNIVFIDNGSIRIIYTGSDNNLYVARLSVTGISSSALGIAIDSNDNVYVANRGSNPPTISKFRILYN
jgi:hypothetical protein